MQRLDLNDVQRHRVATGAKLVAALEMVAPGTALREGIDNILHAEPAPAPICAGPDDLAFLFSGAKSIHDKTTNKSQSRSDDRQTTRAYSDLYQLTKSGPISTAHSQREPACVNPTAYRLSGAYYLS